MSSQSGYQSHRDQRGVFLELWTVDLLDGDLSAALLLSQLLWWHQPSKDGSVKARYERDGHRWLVRADDDWHEDCRLTLKQVRRVRAVLKERGFIEHRRFKVNGAPTSAWRPVFEAIQAAIRPDPELPCEGQFHGSDPGGVVPSASLGALPIPSSPLSKTSKTSESTSRARPIPDQFIVTDAMKVWAAQNTPTVDYRDQTAQFADFHRARGSTMKDWEAAWRTWMRNAVRFAAKGSVNGHKPTAVERSMTTAMRLLREAEG